ncbi:MAG TPA: TrbI/VirB10 family protein [Terriglobales bacterium]|nr:TrbI/VirB10 family protein [Terriglobales bacterium]
MKPEEMTNKEGLAPASFPDAREGSAPADEEESTARAGRGVFRQIVQNALHTARRQHKPVWRRKELGRDKTKSMLLLASLVIGLLLLVLGVLSAPRKVPPASERRNRPNLGRKVTPGQEAAESGKSITPLLDASPPPEAALGHPVTADDVRRTSRSAGATTLSATATPRSEKATLAKPQPSQAYALRDINFDAVAAQPAAGPPLPPPDDSPQLKKPAIVFVRSTPSAGMPGSQPAWFEQTTMTNSLPAGTRIVARFETPVSSAAVAPVVAVVEYNYEREGEIVLPAGAKVFGKLAGAHPSGLVALEFDHVEMPDGSTERIHATAMDLKYGPLKGSVSGQRRGAKFLLSSLTGLGTVAAYVVGGHSTTAFNGPLSENSLLRERVADNVANAGQGAVSQLSFNQNLVVTVPANTRFYLVFEEGGTDPESSGGRHAMGTAVPAAGDDHPPSLEELRELMQLRRELSQIYQPTGVQATTNTAQPPAQ